MREAPKEDGDEDAMGGSSQVDMALHVYTYIGIYMREAPIDARMRMRARGSHEGCGRIYTRVNTYIYIYVSMRE